MRRTCLKCGHENEAASGTELEACPLCGAIYSRVAAAATTVRASTPGPRARRPMSLQEYVDSMRDDSIYPTFRQVVNAFGVVGYLLALVAGLGAIYTLLKINIAAGISGLAFAIFLVIVTRLGKEMSLMLADASDALVRLASRQD